MAWPRWELKFFQRVRFFLRVPSPEQGTSQRILSNFMVELSENLRLGSYLASLLVTSKAGEFNLLA